MRRNKKDQLRRAQEAELNRIVAALAANERNYQQTEDALGIEQLVYERAALMCRYRALLRAVRGGDKPCPSV